jgi:hypothetical protein
MTAFLLGSVLFHGLYLCSGGSVAKEERGQQPPTCDSLLQDFRRPTKRLESIRVVVEYPKSGGERIEYCPDNTCEVFYTKRGSKGACDFAFLYLFHVSGYAELEEQRTHPETVRHAEEVLKRAGSGERTRQAVADTLKRLARDNGIFLEFRRHDEGRIHTVKVSLEEELSQWMSAEETKVPQAP